MRFYRNTLIFTVLLALFSGGSYTYAKQQVAQKIGYEYRPIAVVNDVAITPYDLKKRTQLIKFLSNIPQDTIISQQDRTALLKTMTDEILKEQETKKFKVKIKDERIEAYMKDLARERNMTYSQFMDKLKSIGINKDEAITLFKRSFAWRDLLQGRYGRDISVSTYEIAQIVESNLKTGNLQVDYDTIIIPVEQQSDLQKKQDEALSVLERLKKGENFDALQLSYKTDIAEKHQVKLLSQAPVELHSFMMKARNGEISSIIRTQNGFEIVRLNSKKADEAMPKLMKKSYIIGYLPKDEYIQEKADNLLAKTNNCEDLSDDLNDVEEYNFQALSEASEDIRADLETLQAGQSKIISSDADKMKVLSVCSTKQLDYYADINPQIREQIQQRLLEHKLSLKEKEYLRDLRSNAVITIFSSDF